MTDSDITIGIASTQAVVTALSAFTLSVQRAYLHKTKETPNLRFDTKRKSTNTHDPSRLRRLSFDTLGLVALSVYEFYQTIYHPKSWHHHVSACVQLISWLYAFVIILVAGKHALPSTWGWNLNIHLFSFYFIAWVISINNFYTVITSNSNDTLLHLSSSLLFLILTSDLVYTSGTRPRGAEYLDENGKPVIGVEVVSLFSVLYFNWATPLLNLAYKKQKLTDNDLPTLPALFRGYNLFYIFGATAGSLLKRIYHANRRAILIQVVMALFSSIFYYMPAYFVKQLLTLIQDMNGQEDADMIRRGFVFVTALGVTVFISALVTGQLCYFASSDVQIKVKAMLNIEIYNKTLRRRDLSIDTKKDNTEENTEESAEKDTEEEVESSTGTIINLMSTDSDGIAQFATWWWSVLEAPAELGVGIYFLYTLLGKSCFLGLLVMVIILPVNHYNAKMYASTQDKLMESRDKRVSLMNEMLQGIRQIKFFAWETNWEKRVMEARGVELYHLAITYMSNILFTLTWQG